MAVSYDPTVPGQKNLVNSPYQYWKGFVPNMAGGYVEFVINNKVYTTKVEADGNWEYQPPLSFKEGGHNITIRYFDRAGNAGAPIQTRLEVDLSAPEKPVISRVIDDEGAVTGPVGDKGFTDDNTPKISGYAEPDSIVRLYSNGVLVGSAQAAKNGQWTIEPQLNDGEQRLYITATDAFGQVSVDSDVFTLFVNTPRIDKPQLLEVYDNEGVNTGALKMGQETNDTSPRLSGNAPNDAESVHIYVNGVRVAIAMVTDGKWSWESATSLLQPGENRITLRSQNIRGEMSNESDAFVVNVVPTPPVVIEYALDNFGPAQGELHEGALTDDFTPTLKGTAEANSIVYVYATRENGSWWLKGSAKTDSQGNWEVEISRLDGGAGPYHFQASNSPTRDVNAPLFDLYVSDNGDKLKPVIIAAVDNYGDVQGELGHGALTDDFTPTLKGTAQANSIVFIHATHKNGVWVLKASVKADAHGNWEVDIPKLAGGNGLYHFQASNSSVRNPADAVFDLNVTGNSSMLKPVIEAAFDNVGDAQGELKSGALTDDFTPTLKGTAQANSIVYLHATHEKGAWVLKASVKADAFGNWEVEIPRLAGGDGLYHFQASDSAVRNPSDTLFDLKVSSYANVLKPVIEYATDNFGPVKGDIKDGGITDDKTPMLKGKGVPGAIIEIQYGLSTAPWATAGTAVVDASGNWVFQSPALSSEGLWQFRGRTINGASKSEWTDTFKINIYENIDKAPEITHAADDFGPVTGDIKNGGITDDKTPTLKGKGVPGAIIEIQYGLSTAPWATAGTAVVDASGNWVFQSPALSSEGLWEYRGRTINGSSKSEWTDKFKINVYENIDKAPEITHAADDFGPVKGDIKHDGITDDKTPTLKGKGAPGAVIELEYYVSGVWKAAGSAQVSTGGSWSITSPSLTQDGPVWYRARTVNGSAKSAWSSNFKLNISENIDKAPEITHAADDFGPVKGDIKDGGITDDKTPTLKGKGAAGAVIELEYYVSGAWKAAGSALADASGSWSITSPSLTQDGPVWYRARTVNGSDKSAWSSNFKLNISENIDKAPEITHAADDFGPVKGDIKHDGITDDKTPTLKGKGAAGAVIELEYYVSGAWKAAGSALADASGSWSITSPSLTQDGPVWYRARTVNGSDKSAWSSNFKLNISENIDKAPEITHAADDFGPVKGDIKHNGITDDKTPTLKGKGAAGAVIELEYYVSGAWKAAGSALADASGSWSITSPSLTQDGPVWYRARTVNGSDKSAWSSNFAMHIDSGYKKEGYSWDFNDGTLQGWTAAGKYAKNKDLYVAKWTGAGGTYCVGSMTSDKSTSGYNGDVIYRYITVEKGQIYQISFDGKDLSSQSKQVKAPSLGVTIDGEKVIPEITQSGNWTHYTGYYVANETKRVKVAVINGTATGTGNDFALDNVRVLAQADKKLESFTLNPDGNHKTFYFGLNKTYTLGSGLQIKLQKDSTINMKDMRDGYMELGRGSDTLLRLPEASSKVQMTLGLVHAPGSIVYFYDEGGKLLQSKSLSYSSNINNQYEIEYTAPTGKKIASMIVRVGAGEVDMAGSPGGIQIHDVLWQPVKKVMGMQSFEENTHSITSAEENIDLLGLLENQRNAKVVDITGNGAQTINVDVAGLLKHGEKNLFINDGKQQIMVKGDNTDTVQLSKLLPEGFEEGSWIQQSGNITVGGVAYNVYNHSSTDTELLVQQGVKMEVA